MIGFAGGLVVGIVAGGFLALKLVAQGMIKSLKAKPNPKESTLQLLELLD